MGEPCSGYSGLGPYSGTFVFDEEALPFALEKSGLSIVDETAPEFKEFREMFVDWFYSGPWVHEEEVVR